MSDNQAIVRPHAGAEAPEFLAGISRATNLQRYIEIGLSSGACFERVVCEHGVAVDPEMNPGALGVTNRTRTSLFRLTSNEFFHLARPRRVLGGPADLVFLHGPHWFEILLRDFLNAEAVCARDAMIAFDNALPLTCAMADRDPARAVAQAEGTPFASWWTGDVWKLIPILRKYRPDLTLSLTDARPAGLVVVTGLDPSSRILGRRYDAIVREFMARPNDAEEIAALQNGTAIISTDEALARLGKWRFAETPPPLSARLLARASSTIGRWRRRR